MKKVMLVSIVILIFAAAFSVADEMSAAQTTEKPWFDMEKCAFCKTLGAEPGLLEHMNTHYYDINNGILSITQIDKDFQPAFKSAQENMQKIVADMATGKMPYMCEHCTKVGMFHMMGVKFDEIAPDFGNVVVWSSADSSIVGQLQAFGTRNNEELAKFAAEKK